MLQFYSTYEQKDEEGSESLENKKAAGKQVLI